MPPGTSKYKAAHRFASKIFGMLEVGDCKVRIASKDASMHGPQVRPPRSNTELHVA